MTGRGEALAWDATIPNPREEARTPARSAETYRRALSDPPPRGSGMGHSWLLSTANYAALAGIDPAQAAQDLADARPGKPPREYREAVSKAYAGRGDARTWNPAPRTPAKPKADTGRLWREALARWPEGADPCEALWESSPVRLQDPVEGDAALMLRTLYRPEEFLYIGGAKESGALGGNVRTVADWLSFFEGGGIPGPHFITNPLSGEPAPTKDGKLSLRGDAAVLSHKFMLVEFDGLPKWQQAAFWLTTKLPLAAVIDSGGKSLHGLLRVDCGDGAAWAREVKPLYAGILKDLGADPATCNPARLSRTPGVARGEDWQRLLWLRGGA